MSKRTVEMEDDLQERVDNVEEEIKDNFITYLKENSDIKDFEEYYQASGCECVHEVSDSNVPIMNKNIDDLYYLYGDMFDEAYKNAGLGDGTEYNHRQVTIYCYLSEQGFDYLRELEELFNERTDGLTIDTKIGKLIDLIKELESK